MGGLFLFILAVALIAAGRGSVVLWIIGGVLVLAAFGSLLGKNTKKNKKAAESPRTRIDRPHCISPDAYECATCGARFPKPLQRCPRCGVIFSAAKTDYEEFDDEEELMDILDEWDEEDGR